MENILPIGIDAILTGWTVESVRLELKASWDVQTTGPQVIETLCAFANDLQNLNGGYIVIGVEEQNGVAVRPVRGLGPHVLDGAQKWIRGNCNPIDPNLHVYFRSHGGRRKNCADNLGSGIEYTPSPSTLRAQG